MTSYSPNIVDAQNFNVHLPTPILEDIPISFSHNEEINLVPANSEVAFSTQSRDNDYVIKFDSACSRCMSGRPGRLTTILPNTSQTPRTEIQGFNGSRSSATAAGYNSDHKLEYFVEAMPRNLCLLCANDYAKEGAAILLADDGIVVKMTPTQVNKLRDFLKDFPVVKHLQVRNQTYEVVNDTSSHVCHSANVPLSTNEDHDDVIAYNAAAIKFFNTRLNVCNVEERILAYLLSGMRLKDLKRYVTSNSVTGIHPSVTSKDLNKFEAKWGVTPDAIQLAFPNPFGNRKGYFSDPYIPSAVGDVVQCDFLEPDLNDVPEISDDPKVHNKNSNRGKRGRPKKHEVALLNSTSSLPPQPAVTLSNQNPTNITIGTSDNQPDDTYKRAPKLVAHGGATHGFVSIDEYSDFIIGFLVTTVKRPQEVVKRLVLTYSRENHHIKHLTADSGVIPHKVYDILNTEVQQYLLEQGIKWRRAEPHNHQNGTPKAERAIRSIKELIFLALNYILNNPNFKDLGYTKRQILQCWGDLFHWAIMMLNMRTLKGDISQTRYSKFYRGVIPNIQDIRLLPIFSVLYVYKETQNPNLPTTKSYWQRALYVGPSITVKGAIRAAIVTNGTFTVIHSTRFKGVSDGGQVNIYPKVARALPYLIDISVPDTTKVGDPVVTEAQPRSLPSHDDPLVPTESNVLTSPNPSRINSTKQQTPSAEINIYNDIETMIPFNSGKSSSSSKPRPQRDREPLSDNLGHVPVSTSSTHRKVNTTSILSNLEFVSSKTSSPKAKSKKKKKKKSSSTLVAKEQQPSSTNVQAVLSSSTSDPNSTLMSNRLSPTTTSIMLRSPSSNSGPVPSNEHNSRTTRSNSRTMSPAMQGGKGRRDGHSKSTAPPRASKSSSPTDRSVRGPSPRPQEKSPIAVPTQRRSTRSTPSEQIQPHVNPSSKSGIDLQGLKTRTRKKVDIHKRNSLESFASSVIESNFADWSTFENDSYFYSPLNNKMYCIDNTDAFSPQEIEQLAMHGETIAPAFDAPDDVISAYQSDIINSNPDLVHLFTSIRTPVSPSGLHTFPVEEECFRAVTKGTPRSFKDALSDPKWGDPARKEWQTILEAKTLLQVDKSIAEEAIRNGADKVIMFPVYEEKIKDAQTVYKVRLVANGKHHHPVESTYSPTPHREEFLLLLHLAAVFNWIICHVDEKRAFLAATYKGSKEVYTKLVHSSEWYRVLGALYGLKTSPKDYQTDVIERLLKMGYRRLVLSSCLYIKHVGTEYVIIFDYVDDFIVTGSSREVITKHFIEPFRLAANTTEPVWDPTLILGMEIVRHYDHKAVSITMTKRIVDLCALFNIDDNTRARKMPMPPGGYILVEEEYDLLLNASHKEYLPPQEIKQYLQIVGSLVWISGVRMDIIFATLYLSWHTQKPRRHHRMMATYLMGYLWYTKDVPLVLGGSSIIQPIVYTDSSLATGPQRRSISGQMTRLNPQAGAIFSKSSATQGVRLSSFESELDALVSGCKTIEFVQNLLIELQIRTNPPQVFADNQAMINFVKGEGNVKGARHMDMRLWYSRELYLKSSILLDYMTGVTIPSNFMTKLASIDNHAIFLHDVQGHALLPHIFPFPVRKPTRTKDSDAVDVPLLESNNNDDIMEHAEDLSKL